MKSWASESLRSMEPNPFGTIRQKLQGRTDVINLSSGDPEFPTPPHIVEAAYQAMKSGETHYTMTNGIPELRTEIAKYYFVDQCLDIRITPIYPLPPLTYSPTYYSARE